MAPRIPWEDRQDPTGEDKFMAAMFAIFLILFSIVGILIIGSLMSALWSAGLLKTIIIIGVFSSLFTIGRAIYHIILEKDFL